jgi:glycosyltransferase involved in cell wall biosynthesis
VQDIWSEGKCGFKALQYMALEIPTVLSPVGVNTKIVTDGENGFVVETPEEWKRRLVALITDKELRIKLGKKGKETIDKHYSVNANKTVFLNLFSL